MKGGKMRKKLFKDKKGVFGLTAIQSFFAIILGIALFAYVIVVIMGTLYGSSLIAQTANTTYLNQSQNILMNVSAGVTGFFSAISPVYSILAILVIILVLVVLVRVVQAPQGSATPQL
jgi:hypothetical protein